MTPFLLSPSGKDYIWGGERLKSDYGKALELSPLAETWECSVHPDGPSFVASGAFAGRTLAEVLAENPAWLGTSFSALGGLHILVKLIDAKRDLSVQVHPDDDFAFREEGGQQGKTEMWYVLDAEPGACLVFGLDRSTSAETLRAGLAEGTFESLLKRFPVRRGDVFYIPSGTIHAIGSGIVLAEVQQNSNLTYRLYDYGRVGKDGRPRELHVDKALAVADLSGARPQRQPLRALRYRPGFAEEELCACPYFQVWLCRVDAGEDSFGDPGSTVGAGSSSELVSSSGGAGSSLPSDILLPMLPESYRVLLCTEGEGVLREGGDGAEDGDVAADGAGDGTSSGGAADLRFRKGDTIFIPATCGPLRLSGRAAFLLIRG